jgi:hypothetical protein
MSTTPRRSVGLHVPRARRLCALPLLLSTLCQPVVAHATGLESCLVRRAEPALEWTLVEPAAFAPVAFAGDSVIADASEPQAPPVPLLAFESQPTGHASTGLAGDAASIQGPAPGGNIFIRAWLPITIGEFSLLCITALLPKDFTGWSADFVDEGAGHFAEAWTKPPVWDTDHWFHNYVGHPYGGSFYYNSVRSRGATPLQSMAFTAVLSAQWEYIFEAVAERPSIQDLVVTPVAGWALGELTHRMSNKMRQGRVTLLEKIAMTALNPADVLTHGYKSVP